MTSSPDPFEYFHLDPDKATDRELKKAYAAKLKTIRPEEDREGFMALRRAFEQARAQIQWRIEDEAYEAAASANEEVNSAPQTPEETILPDPSSGPKEHLNPIIHNQWHQSLPEEPAIDETSGPNPPDTIEDDPVTIALEDIQSLIKSPFAAGSFAPWKAIIERDDLQTIDNYQNFSDRLRSFVCEETGLYDEVEDGTGGPLMRFPSWLSVAVLKGLGNTFGWHKQHSRTYWIRGENDWIAKLGVEYAKPGEPTQRQAEQIKSRNRVMGQSGVNRQGDPHSSGGHVYKEEKSNAWAYWIWIIVRIAIVGFIITSFLRE